MQTSPRFYRPLLLDCSEVLAKLRRQKQLTCVNSCRCVGEVESRCDWEKFLLNLCVDCVRA